MAHASLRFRRATPGDVEAILRLMSVYYSEDEYPFSDQQARVNLTQFVDNPSLGSLWVATISETLAAYLVVTLGFSFEYGGQDAFIDELYVAEAFRGVGLGREALDCAEAYCREMGVRALHLEVERHRTRAAELYDKVGFRENGRRLMTKRLPSERGSVDASPAGIYGEQLARIHHHHFGDLARAAAAHLLRLHDESGRRSGTVVELACGGGISSRILSDAGYDVVGIDVSESMVEIARVHAPRATFVRRSLWEYEVAHADAITVIGEAFCYHSPGTEPTLAALAERLRSLFEALPSGGVLLFDVATPGRSGATGHRRAAWETSGTFVYLDEREDRGTSSLTRIIDTFVPAGGMHRRHREEHRLTLYDADAVERTLSAVGFRWIRSTKVGSFELLPGWVAFEAVKP